MCTLAPTAIYGKETVWDLEREIYLQRLPDFVLGVLKPAVLKQISLPPVTKEELEFARQLYFNPSSQKSEEELEKLKQDRITQHLQIIGQGNVNEYGNNGNQFNECGTTAIPHLLEFKESENIKRKRVRCDL